MTRGLTVFQPENLKDPASQERVRAAGAEVIVVAAYGLLLLGTVLFILPFLWMVSGSFKANNEGYRGLSRAAHMQRNRNCPSENSRA